MTLYIFVVKLASVIRVCDIRTNTSRPFSIPSEISLVLFTVIIYVIFNLLEHVAQPEHSNVCFWYVPLHLRGLLPGPDRDARLHRVSAKQNRTSTRLTMRGNSVG